MSNTTASTPLEGPVLNACQKKIIARSARDLKSICKQIIRFSQMPEKNLMAQMSEPSSMFCTIPHPSGNGDIFCGSIAWNIFSRVANSLIEFEPALERRITLNGAKKNLVKIFVQRVLQEKREPDRMTAELIFDDLSKKSLESLKNSEHYLPCVLFHNGGPDEFTIGPVNFARTAKFLQNNSRKLRYSVEQNIADQINQVTKWVEQGYPIERVATKEQSKKLVRDIQARVLKTYRIYPWVASVKIVGCDREVSGERASKTAEAALHVIRLLLGASITKKIRLARSPGNTLTFAGMWTDEVGIFHMSTSSMSMGPVGSENWYEILNHDNGYERHLLGSAISPLSNPRPIFHLHQRILDSIHWFGDAATELEPTSRVIKYTSGIERLLFGKFQRGQKTVFAERLRAICCAFGCDKDNKVYHDAINLYDARSALLHGAFSPRYEKAYQLATLAENLCRLCILCAGQLFPALLRNLGEVSPEQLEDVMKEITDDTPKAMARWGVMTA